MYFMKFGSRVKSNELSKLLLFFIFQVQFEQHFIDCSICTRTYATMFNFDTYAHALCLSRFS